MGAWQDEQAGYNLSSPYQDSTGFQNAYQKLAQQQMGLGSSDRAGVVSRLNAVGDQFKNIFSNNVGRAATPEELDKFFNENAHSVIANSPNGRSETNPTDVRNQIAQYVGDTFQQQAQKTAEGKLSDLSSEAGGLADQFLSMGKASLGSLANDLQDYQTRLFDKLRPQLNLAAQAGGYADSGGQTLQERGALTDLGTAAMGTLIPLQNQLQTQANAIRYGGAAAPYSLASSFAAGQPSVLAATGAGGLDANNSSFLANLNFAHQMALLNMQGGIESNLQNNGFGFGNNFSKSFGSGLGGNLADIGSNALQGGLGKLGMPGMPPVPPPA